MRWTLKMGEMKELECENGEGTNENIFVYRINIPMHQNSVTT
jgi:hypothetical protein